MADPDPQVIERMATAMAEAGSNSPGYFSRVTGRTRSLYRRMARAAYHVLEGSDGAR